MDKYILKFLNIIDRYTSFIDNLFAPRCKCKRKKNK